MNRSATQVAVLTKEAIVREFGIESSFVKFLGKVLESLIEGYWVFSNPPVKPQLLHSNLFVLLRHKTCSRFRICPLVDVCDGELVFSTKALTYQGGDLIRDCKPIWKKFSDEGKNVITLNELLTLTSREGPKQTAPWECVGLQYAPVEVKSIKLVILFFDVVYISEKKAVTEEYVDNIKSQLLFLGDDPFGLKSLIEAKLNEVKVR